MALDILAVPASSVSCERLFSRAKLVSTDNRASLGADVFEALEALNFFWKDKITDYARANTKGVEEIEHVLEADLAEYRVYEDADQLFAAEEVDEDSSDEAGSDVLRWGN